MDSYRTEGGELSVQVHQADHFKRSLDIFETISIMIELPRLNRVKAE
jgi:hypothetical protein